MSAAGEGFFDPQGARRALHRIRLRHSPLEAQALAATLLHRLDQLGEALSDHLSAFGSGGNELTGDDVDCRIGGDAIGHVKCKYMSEEELLKGVDLVLQFLNSVFELLGHGLFSTAETAAEATACTEAPESKKGGGK